MMKKKIMTLICFILSNNCIQAMQTDEMSEIGGLQNREDPYFSAKSLFKTPFFAGAFENEENKPQQTEKNKKSTKNKIKNIKIDYKRCGDLFLNFSNLKAELNFHIFSQNLPPDTNESVGSAQDTFDYSNPRLRKGRGSNAMSRERRNQKKLTNAEEITNKSANALETLYEVCDRISNNQASMLFSQVKTSYKDFMLLYSLFKEQNKVSSDMNVSLLQKTINLQQWQSIIFLTEQNKDLQIPPDVPQKILDQLDAKNGSKILLTPRYIDFCISIFNADRIINIDLMKTLAEKENKNIIPFCALQLVSCAVGFYLLKDKILRLEEGVKSPFNEANKRIIAEKMENPQVEQSLRITLFIESFNAGFQASNNGTARLLIFKLFYRFFSPYKYETAHLVIDQFLEENAAKYPELYKFWQENQTAISEIEKKGYFALFDIFPWYSKDPIFAEMRENTLPPKKRRINQENNK